MERVERSAGDGRTDGRTQREKTVGGRSRGVSYLLRAPCQIVLLGRVPRTRTYGDRNLRRGEQHTRLPRQQQHCIQQQ